VLVSWKPDALVDAFILASGARDAASAIETHAMADIALTSPANHETLLSTALRQIDLAIKSAGKPAKTRGA
jgi:hypothetical protein